MPTPPLRRGDCARTAPTTPINPEKNRDPACPGLGLGTGLVARQPPFLHPFGPHLCPKSHKKNQTNNNLSWSSCPWCKQTREIGPPISAGRGRSCRHTGGGGTAPPSLPRGGGGRRPRHSPTHSPPMPQFHPSEKMGVHLTLRVILHFEHTKTLKSHREGARKMRRPSTNSRRN